MRVVTATEIDGGLTFPALIDTLDEAFRGGIASPTRHHHTFPRSGGDATLLLMPAWTHEAAGGFVGVKVVSVFAGNAALREPSVQGTYILMDGRTGRPLAALDGTRLTLWRTAGASALAARFLASSETRRMVMVGAGALAPYLVRAHCAVRPIETIAIWARRPDAAERLAATLSAEGLPAHATVDLEGAIGKADLVSCATLAATPLVQGAWLRPGAHVDLVGAFTLAMREADDLALHRASVYVDTPAALTEGGDVAVAIATGAYPAARVRGDLSALVTGRVPGRTNEGEITLFKSVGAALEDLAAAALVWRNLDLSSAKDDRSLTV